MRQRRVPVPMLAVIAGLLLLTAPILVSVTAPPGPQLVAINQARYPPPPTTGVIDTPTFTVAPTAPTTPVDQTPPTEDTGTSPVAFIAGGAAILLAALALMFFGIRGIIRDRRTP